MKITAIHKIMQTLALGALVLTVLLPRSSWALYNAAQASDFNDGGYYQQLGVAAFVAKVNSATPVYGNLDSNGNAQMGYMLLDLTVISQVNSNPPPTRVLVLGNRDYTNAEGTPHVENLAGQYAFFLTAKASCGGTTSANKESGGKTDYTISKTTLTKGYTSGTKDPSGVDFCNTSYQMFHADGLIPLDGGLCQVTDSASAARSFGFPSCFGSPTP